ncbi:MAG: hypothetical protein JWO89_906 [Verrucomicrobiaceae bacterium]|nr:hypothetical protein [Verrucomicrobiaceae bacterium]
MTVFQPDNTTSGNVRPCGKFQKRQSPVMSNTFRANADYTVIDRAPLSLRKGQIVKPGRRDADWPGWVWVTSDDGRGSYVPEEILDASGDDLATVVQAFEAHDLSVKKHEAVTSLREVRGWHWCRNGAGTEGWLPSYLLVAGE